MGLQKCRHGIVVPFVLGACHPADRSDAGVGSGIGSVGDSGTVGDADGGDDGDVDGMAGSEDASTGANVDGGGSDSTEASSADADADSGPSVATCDTWADPLPALPDANDAEFPVGTSWHVGPNGVEYQISIPEGDTSALPLVLTADPYNGGLRFEPVIWVYFPVETGGHNSWIDDEFWNCWPGCSVFTFLGVDGTEALLLDLGTRLRFAHDRVFMDGVGEGREEVTMGLDPALQTYFAGVVHYYSEWQMAVCPAVAGTTPDPCAPKVMFGMAGCDHSWCPSDSCYETVAAAGYDVTQLVGGDVSGCPCPLEDLNDVPHILPMPDWVRDAHVSFVLETSK